MLSVILPTMNRVDFVIRQLKFYCLTGFKYKIYIADSSDIKEYKRLICEVSKLGMDAVEVVRCESMTCYQATSYILDNYITTKYSVWIGDDDFLILDGIEKSIQFLENNDGYVCCHGKCYAVQTYNDKLYGKINQISRYYQAELHDEGLVERVLRYSECASVSLFAVHRTETFKAMYKGSKSIDDRTFSSEILPLFIGVAMGKYKEIDALSMIRHVHAGRYYMQPFMDWIFSGDWLMYYARFKDCFVEIVCEVDSEITKTVASNLSDMMIGKYIQSIYQGARSCSSILARVKSFMANHEYFRQVFQVYSIYRLKCRRQYIDLINDSNCRNSFLDLKAFLEG